MLRPGFNKQTKNKGEKKVHRQRYFDENDDDVGRYYRQWANESNESKENESKHVQKPWGKTGREYFIFGISDEKICQKIREKMKKLGVKEAPTTESCRADILFCAEGDIDTIKFGEKRGKEIVIIK